MTYDALMQALLVRDNPGAELDLAVELQAAISKNSIRPSASSTSGGNGDGPETQSVEGAEGADGADADAGVDTDANAGAGVDDDGVEMLSSGARRLELQPDLIVQLLKGWVDLQKGEALDLPAPGLFAYSEVRTLCLYVYMFICLYVYMWCLYLYTGSGGAMCCPPLYICIYIPLSYPTYPLSIYILSL
jgi:hypothetical protein